MDYNTKITDAILGLAIGDAVGVPVEFVQPDILKERPVTTMQAGGSHNQPLGTWSDDTSMTLALMDALAYSGDEPDYSAIMKNFLDWVEQAKYTSGDKVFDIGKTCLKSIANFARGMDPLQCGQKGEFDCGNGALMRILPMAFWCYKYYGKDFIENDDAIKVINNVTSLTHGYSRCLMASGMYLSIVAELLSGESKKRAVQIGLEKAKHVYEQKPEYQEELVFFSRLFKIGDSVVPDDEIKSSGYVVDTMEAAIWAFLTTDSYKDCILKGINLGHDTDTVGAVAGGLAGLYYGKDTKCGIPNEWMSNMKRTDYLKELCTAFAEHLS